MPESPAIESLPVEAGEAAAANGKPASPLAFRADPPACRKPLAADGRQRILWRIARYLKPYRPQGALLVFVLVTGAIAELLVPLIIQQITDNALIRGGGFQLVIRLVAALFGVRVLLWITEVFRGWLNSWMGGRITADIRAELLRRLEHLPLRFYDSSQVGVLMSRIVKDAATVEEF